MTKQPYQAIKEAVDKTASAAAIASAKSDLLSRLRRTFRGFDVRDDSDENVLVSRYLGEWEVPDGEEDDGDYDWMVPTQKSSEMIKQIVAEVEKAYPVKIQPQVEEKSYIDFVITARDKP